MQKKIGMRKCLKSLFAIVIILASVSACNSTDDENAGNYERVLNDSIKVDAIREIFEPEDSAVVEAYVLDKSTITINDIDPKDTTYTTRSKTLYHPGPDGKQLAIVYGYKTKGKGKAVVQKVGEKPIILKEGEMEGNIRNYSNGSVTLQKADTFAFLNGVQYIEIQ